MELFHLDFPGKLIFMPFALIVDSCFPPCGLIFEGFPYNKGYFVKMAMIMEKWTEGDHFVLEEIMHLKTEIRNLIFSFISTNT